MDNQPIVLIADNNSRYLKSLLDRLRRQTYRLSPPVAHSKPAGD